MWAAQDGVTGGWQTERAISTALACSWAHTPLPVSLPSPGNTNLPQSSLHVFHKCRIIGFPEEPGGHPLIETWEQLWKRFLLVEKNRVSIQPNTLMVLKWRLRNWHDKWELFSPSFPRLLFFLLLGQLAAAPFPCRLASCGFRTISLPLFWSQFFMVYLKYLLVHFTSLYVVYFPFYFCWSTFTIQAYHQERRRISKGLGRQKENTVWSPRKAPLWDLPGSGNAESLAPWTLPFGVPNPPEHGMGADLRGPMAPSIYKRVPSRTDSWSTERFY